jgi:selenocysteine lyase/cysteine desulfurase
MHDARRPGRYSAAMSAISTVPGPGKPQAWRSSFDLPPDTLYLDTAAHAPLLRCVREAGSAALARSNAPWMPDSGTWEACVDRVRALAAAWFDGDAHGVAFIPSVAYGIATAAHNLPLQRGESVLVLDGQFPSNLLAWQQRCAQSGATIVVARREPAQDWTDAVLAALERNPGIRIAALPQAHWHDGALLDLDTIAPRVRAGGAALVLDLSQSLGALPTDFARWQPDFVASVGYKWLLGVTGLGMLWVAPHWRKHGRPIEQHWSAREDEVWRSDPVTPPAYRRGARRFDAGGILEPQRVAMFEAALMQLKAWGADTVLAHLRAMTTALDRALDASGLADWNTPGHAPHFTGLRPPPARFDAVVAALRAANIICTARYGVLRVAPHLHVGEEDMRHCVATMASALDRTH